MVIRLTQSNKTWIWPDDYQTIDGGDLTIRSDFVEHFRSLNFRTVSDIMESEIPIVRRTVGERDNASFTVPGPNFKSNVTCYLKRHRTRKRPGIFQSATPPGIAEANAVRLCQQAGVPTMSVIASGVDRSVGSKSTHCDSVFISEEIHRSIPADDYWIDHVGPPEASMISSDDRLKILEAIADTAKKLHRAKLFHRDFYWCHFFIGHNPDGSPIARLIDLQRLVRSKYLSVRWQIKDVAQFLFSIPPNMLSENEVRHWLKVYHGRKDSYYRRLLNRAFQIRAKFYDWKEGNR